VSAISITPALDESDIATVRSLFLEYAASLDIDLAYQDFQGEVASLPGDFAPPRGCLLLARSATNAVACVGVRPLDPVVCELKRLYVRPEARGTGVGRKLTLAAIDFGKAAEFRAMRLDTLPSMASAQGLYRSLGFRVIAPYRASPIVGNMFMELALERR
jgi:ribosomal protein S18 acetylase RimI-like enzyme